MIIKMLLLLLLFISGCSPPVEHRPASSQVNVIDQSFKEGKISVTYAEVEGVINQQSIIKINEELKLKAFELLNAHKEYLGVSENDIEEYSSDYKVTYKRGHLMSSIHRSKLTIDEEIYLVSPLTFNIYDGRVYNLNDLFKINVDYIERLDLLIKEETRDIVIVDELVRIEEDRFYLTEDSLQLQCLYESGMLLSVSILLSDLKDILIEYLIE